MSSYNCVPNEPVGFLDGFKDGERVREVAKGRDGARLDELA